MTASGQSPIKLLTFSVWLIIIPAICGAQQRAPIAEQIGKAYGVDSFGQIEAIRYTFNIPEFKLSRTWVWEPKTDTVSYEGKDKQGNPVKVTYKRAELDRQSDSVKKQIDPAFVNDHYVLLFPLHVAWDTWATVTDEGMQEMPISKKSARRVAVKYPGEGGYSPGDTWELYVGKNHRIEEFVYRRGGTTYPTVYTATWAGHKKVGPLVVSTERAGTAEDGKRVTLLLTDVAVKVTGSEDWINAQ